MLLRRRAGTTSPGPTEIRKVLIVDDSAVARAVARRALEADGYEVAETDNPMLAPHVMLRERPDVLLVDVEMPGVRGDKVTKILRETVCGDDPVGIFLYSSRPPSELRRLVAECGADGYVHKDRDTEPLLQTVQAWFRRSAA